MGDAPIAAAAAATETPSPATRPSAASTPGSPTRWSTAPTRSRPCVASRPAPATRGARDSSASPASPSVTTAAPTGPRASASSPSCTSPSRRRPSAPSRPSPPPASPRSSRANTWATGGTPRTGARSTARRATPASASSSPRRSPRARCRRARGTDDRREPSRGNRSSVAWRFCRSAMRSRTVGRRGRPSPPASPRAGGARRRRRRARRRRRGTPERRPPALDGEAAARAGTSSSRPSPRPARRSSASGASSGRSASTRGVVPPPPKTPKAPKAPPKPSRAPPRRRDRTPTFASPSAPGSRRRARVRSTSFYPRTLVRGPGVRSARPDRRWGRSRSSPGARAATRWHSRRGPGDSAASRSRASAEPPPARRWRRCWEPPTEDQADSSREDSDSGEPGGRFCVARRPRTRRARGVSAPFRLSRRFFRATPREGYTRTRSLARVASTGSSPWPFAPRPPCATRRPPRWRSPTGSRTRRRASRAPTFSPRTRRRRFSASRSGRVRPRASCRPRWRSAPGWSPTRLGGSSRPRAPACRGWTSGGRSTGSGVGRSRVRRRVESIRRRARRRRRERAAGRRRRRTREAPRRTSRGRGSFARPRRRRASVAGRGGGSRAFGFGRLRVGARGYGCAFDGVGPVPARASAAATEAGDALDLGAAFLACVSPAMAPSRATGSLPRLTLTRLRARATHEGLDLAARGPEAPVVVVVASGGSDEETFLETRETSRSNRPAVVALARFSPEALDAGGGTVATATASPESPGFFAFGAHSARGASSRSGEASRRGANHRGDGRARRLRRRRDVRGARREECRGGILVRVRRLVRLRRGVRRDLEVARRRRVLRGGRRRLGAAVVVFVGAFWRRAPTVRSVTPSRGPAAGGTAATVRGRGFADGRGSPSAWVGALGPVAGRAARLDDGAEAAEFVTPAAAPAVRPVAVSATRRDPSDLSPDATFEHEAADGDYYDRGVFSPLEGVHSGALDEEVYSFGGPPRSGAGRLNDVGAGPTTKRASPDVSPAAGGGVAWLAGANLHEAALEGLGCLVAGDARTKAVFVSSALVACELPPIPEGGLREVGLAATTREGTPPPGPPGVFPRVAFVDAIFVVSVRPSSVAASGGSAVTATLAGSPSGATPSIGCSFGAVGPTAARVVVAGDPNPLGGPSALLCVSPALGGSNAWVPVAARTPSLGSVWGSGVRSGEPGTGGGPGPAAVLVVDDVARRAAAPRDADPSAAPSGSTIFEPFAFSFGGEKKCLPPRSGRSRSRDSEPVRGLRPATVSPGRFRFRPGSRSSPRTFGGRHRDIRAPAFPFLPVRFSSPSRASPRPSRRAFFRASRSNRRDGRQRVRREPQGRRRNRRGRGGPGARRVRVPGFSAPAFGDVPGGVLGRSGPGRDGLLRGASVRAPGRPLSRAPGRVLGLRSLDQRRAAAFARRRGFGFRRRGRPDLGARRVAARHERDPGDAGARRRRRDARGGLGVLVGRDGGGCSRR